MLDGAVIKKVVGNVLKNAFVIEFVEDSVDPIEDRLLNAPRMFTQQETAVNSDGTPKLLLDPDTPRDVFYGTPKERGSRHQYNVESRTPAWRNEYQAEYRRNNQRNDQ